MNEILVKGITLPQAYHRALMELWHGGAVVPCPDWDQTNGTNGTQLEASLTMYVYEPLHEPRISRLFIGGEKELQQYIMEMTDGILDFEVEKGNWNYTYHRRMVNENMDQIKFVIDELKRNPWSRRAVINIRDNKEDMYSEEPACLQHLQYFIRDGLLDCKVLFRSNDACKATFMNAFALIKLQEKIAKELDVPVGTYLHRANSFHCYEKDYDMLKGYVSRIRNSQSEEDLTFSYEDDWKDSMEDVIPEILEKVEKLK